MTNEIYHKAREIRCKLEEATYELGAFKRFIYVNGNVKLIPCEDGISHFVSDYLKISHFVSDYLKRENVATEIIEIMEAEIQKLQKEYEEL